MGKISKTAPFLEAASVPVLAEKPDQSRDPHCRQAAAAPERENPWSVRPAAVSHLGMLGSHGGIGPFYREYVFAGGLRKQGVRLIFVSLDWSRL